MKPLPVPVVLPPPKDVSRSTQIAKLRAPLRPDEIVFRHGVPVTIPVRALRDVMTHAVDFRAAAVAASLACSAGLVSIRELEAHLGGLYAIAGSVKARDAMAYVDDRVRSPPEAELLLAWCLEAGLPRPLMNWPILDAAGNYLGAPDILGVDLALCGEYDSSDHDSDTARDVDADRDSAFRAAGLTTFRLGKRTLRDPERLLNRISQAVAAAEGSRIPRTFVLGTDPEPVVVRELRQMTWGSGGRRAY